MIRRFIAAFAAAFILAACARPAPSPDELRIAVRNEPASLDPLFVQTPFDNDLAALAFDLLVTNDARGNPQPDLAAAVPTLANGGISRDGLTITYRLRRNVALAGRRAVYEPRRRVLVARRDEPAQRDYRAARL